MVVVLPVPFTPTTRMTAGPPAAAGFGAQSGSRSTRRAESSARTAASGPAPSRRARAPSTIRIARPAPTSPAMSVSSTSSQAVSSAPPKSPRRRAMNPPRVRASPVPRSWSSAGATALGGSIGSFRFAWRRREAPPRRPPRSTADLGGFRPGRPGLGGFRVGLGRRFDCPPARPSAGSSFGRLRQNIEVRHCARSVAGTFAQPLGQRRRLVEVEADHPADRVVAHGDAVQRVGRLDRAAVVGDDDELRLVGQRAEGVGEATRRSPRRARRRPRRGRRTGPAGPRASRTAGPPP